MSSSFKQKPGEHVIRVSNHKRELYFIKWHVDSSEPWTIYITEFRMDFPVDENNNPLVANISGGYENVKMSDFKYIRILVKKNRRDIREFLKNNGFEERNSTLFNVWYEKETNDRGDVWSDVKKMSYELQDFIINAACNADSRGRELENRLSYMENRLNALYDSLDRLRSIGIIN